MTLKRYKTNKYSLINKYRLTNKYGLKHIKTQMAAMIPMVESYEARKKEKEEAEKLDMKIQARVREYNKKFYENL